MYVYHSSITSFQKQLRWVGAPSAAFRRQSPQLLLSKSKSKSTRWRWASIQLHSPTNSTSFDSYRRLSRCGGDHQLFSATVPSASAAKLSRATSAWICSLRKGGEGGLLAVPLFFLLPACASLLGALILVMLEPRLRLGKLRAFRSFWAHRQSTYTVDVDISICTTIRCFPSIAVGSGFSTRNARKTIMNMLRNCTCQFQNTAERANTVNLCSKRV